MTLPIRDGIAHNVLLYTFNSVNPAILCNVEGSEVILLLPNLSICNSLKPEIDEGTAQESHLLSKLICFT